MKRFIIYCVSILTAIITFAQSTFTEGGINYMEDFSDPSKMAVIVISNTNSKGINLYKGDVIIPSVVEHDLDEYHVIAIEQGAFMKANELESLIIENGPSQIEEETIHSNSLKSIELPGSLISIKDIEAGNLENIKFTGDGVQEIDGFIFGPKLNELILPNSLINLYGMDCERSVSGIENYQLNKVILGDKIEKIGGVCTIFNGELLEIPSCSQLISSFNICYNLKELKLSDNLNYIESSFDIVNEIEHLIIPNSCNEIILCFREANKLKDLKLGKDINTIYHSFKELESIKKLTIPSNCKKIENSFERLNDLQELIIENGVEEIKESFGYLPNIKKLVIPGSCKDISGFNNMPNLEELIIEEGVETINGFGRLKNIKKLILPSSIKYIDNGLRDVYEQLNNPYQDISDGEEKNISIEEYIKNNTTNIEATFPGGNIAMEKWIDKNIIYPENSKNNYIGGKVFVEFVINEDGTLENIEIVRGINEELNCEAIRLVQSMPKWYPKLLGGVPVKSHYTMPIIFKL